MLKNFLRLCEKKFPVHHFLRDVKSEFNDFIIENFYTDEYITVFVCRRSRHAFCIFLFDRPPRQEFLQMMHIFLSVRVNVFLIFVLVYLAAEHKKFPEGSLDEIFLEALKTERIDFVRLLLLNGVSIDEFLSPSRLRELYSHSVRDVKTCGFHSEKKTIKNNLIIRRRRRNE